MPLTQVLKVVPTGRAQTRPQNPQLEASTAESTQAPEQLVRPVPQQRVVPACTLHVSPPLQVLPGQHTSPEAPQVLVQA